MLKKNIIANCFGQGMVAVLNIFFIPFYIKYMGVEAYGLIGLFNNLQVWFAVLDAVMAPTLSRELARFNAGIRSKESVLDLLRSVEIVVFSVGIILAIIIFLFSKTIASEWLKSDKTPVHQIADSLSLMGVLIAFRLGETMYRSCVVGLQNQLLLNIVFVAVAMLRGLGGIFVLTSLSNTVQAFFIWQGLVTLFSLWCLAFVTYKALSHSEYRPKFNTTELKGILRLASGMICITLLSLLLMQVDKILLSRQLTLSDYGYYTLASTAAGGLFTFTSPITQALYPKLCESHARGDKEQMAEVYHNGAQLVSVLAGSSAIIVVFFSENILQLWSRGQDFGSATGALLSLLMVGNLLNGLMWIPYQTQLAHGLTNITIKNNLIAVIFIVPMLIYIIPKYGSLGAAWVWVLLNFFCLIFGVKAMFTKILINEMREWYLEDLALPLVAGSVSAFAVKVITTTVGLNMNSFFELFIAAITVLFAMIIGAKRVRRNFALFAIGCYK